MMRYLIAGIAGLVIVILLSLQWIAPEHFAVRQPVSTGKALIGGPFTLTDQDGAPFTDADLKGHYSLIYFGFTHCPDICPTSLLIIANAMTALKEQGERVLPVFITVDPERDTVERMKQYVSSFHPRMVGLTGTPEQVKQTADAYKVFFSRVDAPESALGYLVDHSGFIYLMDPQGEYVTHFPHNVAEHTLTATLRQIIR